VFLDYAAAAWLATSFRETALAKEASSSGISRLKPFNTITRDKRRGVYRRTSNGRIDGIPEIELLSGLQGCD